jgi:hypothetical protein
MEDTVFIKGNLFITNFLKNLHLKAEKMDMNKRRYLGHLKVKISAPKSPHSSQEILITVNFFLCKTYYTYNIILYMCVALSYL